MYHDRKGLVRRKPSGIIPRERRSAYGVFIQDEKALLVMPRWNDKWELPGGGAEEGETLFDALRREFREETGFTIRSFAKKPLRVIDSQFYADDLDEYYDSRMSFFLVREAVMQEERHDDEIADVRFIPLSSLRRDGMRKDHFDVLSSLAEGEMTERSRAAPRRR